MGDERAARAGRAEHDRSAAEEEIRSLLVDRMSIAAVGMCSARSERANPR
jgi:hypothetical protein